MPGWNTTPGVWLDRAGNPIDLSVSGSYDIANATVDVSGTTTLVHRLRAIDMYEAIKQRADAVEAAYPTVSITLTDPSTLGGTQCLGLDQVQGLFKEWCAALESMAPYFVDEDLAGASPDKSVVWGQQYYFERLVEDYNLIGAPATWGYDSGRTHEFQRWLEGLGVDSDFIEGGGTYYIDRLNPSSGARGWMAFYTLVNSMNWIYADNHYLESGLAIDVEEETGLTSAYTDYEDAYDSVLKGDTTTTYNSDYAGSATETHRVTNQDHHVGVVQSTETSGSDTNYILRIYQTAKLQRRPAVGLDAAQTGMVKTSSRHYHDRNAYNPQDISTSTWGGNGSLVTTIDSGMVSNATGATTYTSGGTDYAVGSWLDDQQQWNFPDHADYDAVELDIGGHRFLSVVEFDFDYVTLT